MREVGLAELKGPGDDADEGDFHDLMSHAWQLTKLEGIGEPSALCLFVVANNLTKSFRERCEAYGGQFGKEDKGIWLVRGLPHVLYFVESGEVHELEGEELMYMFSDGFVSRPGDIKLRNKEQLGLFIYLCQQVEQLKGSVGTMALKDLEKLDRAQEEALLELVTRLPREKVLSRYTFDERLRGLPAEERLRGLPAEEVLERFGPEERLRGLQFEEVLKALSPEQVERFKKFLH